MKSKSLGVAALPDGVEMNDIVKKLPYSMVSMMSLGFMMVAYRDEEGVHVGFVESSSEVVKLLNSSDNKAITSFKGEDLDKCMGDWSATVDGGLRVMSKLSDIGVSALEVMFGG